MTSAIYSNSLSVISEFLRSCLFALAPLIVLGVGCRNVAEEATHRQSTVLELSAAEVADIINHGDELVLETDQVVPKLPTVRKELVTGTDARAELKSIIDRTKVNKITLNIGLF